MSCDRPIHVDYALLSTTLGKHQDPRYERDTIVRFGQNTSEGRGSFIEELLNTVGMPFMFYNITRGITRPW